MADTENPVKPKIIEPSVGRKIWFHPGTWHKSGPGGMSQLRDDPLDATIVAVHNTRMVNVLVVDANAKLHAALSTTLVQAGDPLPQAGQSYATWVPFQLGQAKKVD